MTDKERGLRNSLSLAIRQAIDRGMTADETLAVARTLIPPPPIFKADVYERLNDGKSFRESHLSTLVTGPTCETALDAFIQTLRTHGCLIATDEMYLIRLARYQVPEVGSGDFEGEDWFIVRAKNDAGVEIVRTRKPKF